jgi:ATP-binding cassette, subfamily B (MDR/TAP), member 6
LFALCLISKERHYQLPSTPSRGHGVILLLFFTLNFISQNVALINLNAEDWWFQMKTKRDNIEMGLFITRYIGTMLCFVLGLKAPGIQSIENEDETVLIDNESQNNVSFNLITCKCILIIFILLI